MNDCHESVVDGEGMFQPCGREASGWAVDDESLYPACDAHATDTAAVMRLAVDVLAGRSLLRLREADVRWSGAVRDWCKRRGIEI